jgi:glycosyltransferase involved in cell wall biosynthesis
MINHPFDEDHGEKVTGWEDLRRKLQHELDSDHLLFHPTRQDWVEGTGYADKANDVFLKAFCALRSQGLKIGLVCCEWGNNVSASKQLVAQEKCSRYVKWVQPLPVVAFERTCLACDIVVDQFKLGSFGGVLFKAMAVGRPILTFLDEKQVLNQYAECPPVINCRTQQGITDALLRVLSRSNELERLGKLSRAWITKHHGKAATVNAQVDQFRLFDLSKKERGRDRSPTARQ